MFKNLRKGFFPSLIAFSALSVSASAAFYSVSGLSKLFAGASFEVMVMAGSLEVAKLVVASLLYQYWDTINKGLRAYLSIATIILVLITSMGIYGFLSSDYQETANKATIVDQQILALETKKKLYQQSQEGIYKEKQSLAGLKESLSKGSTTQFTDRKGNLVVRSNNASIKQIKSASNSDDKLSSKLDRVNDSIFSLENKILEVKTNSTVSSGDVGFGLFYPDRGIIILSPAALEDTVGSVNVDGASVSIAGSASTSVEQENHKILVNAINVGGDFQARRTENVSTQHFFVRATNREFNYSNNPTYVNATGTFAETTFETDPQTYITTIGLMNDANEMIAVAKASQPIQKSFDKEVLIKVKLSF